MVSGDIVPPACPGRLSLITAIAAGGLIGGMLLREGFKIRRCLRER